MRHAHRLLSRILPALLLTLGGCPAFPVVDPVAHARIVNDSSAAVTVTLTLNEAEGEEPAFVEEQLREFTRGEGVTIVTMNAASRTATYRIEAAGHMIVYEGMGHSPYFHFERLQIKHGTNEQQFRGREELKQAFEPARVSGSYRYELLISTLFRPRATE